MGSSQEYNVQNIISWGTNALPRYFSTSILTLKKKSITAFPYRLLQNTPRMTEASLGARQTWKPGTESWAVNQDNDTQKFLCSFPSPSPKACVEGLWIASQVSMSVCCLCHVSLISMLNSQRAYLKSHLITLADLPEALKTSINFGQM